MHPTQKPLELCRYMIRTYTNKGDTVLDNCMGSGTCGVAAIMEERKFLGIEKDEKYFDIAKKRINKIRKKDIVLYNISEYSEFDDVKRKVVSFKEPKALDILREDLNPSVRKAVIENGREEDLDYFSENGTADDRATLLLTHKRDSDLDKAMDDSFYTNWDLSKCLK